MRLRHSLGVTFLSPLLLLAQSREAGACGGCFIQTGPMSTVVSAHRMAFATSKTRTVLWDQIRYSGAPSEFSWVLPFKGEAKLEPADDAWFETLETVTNARVSPPQLNCYTGTTSGGSGCACGGASADSASFGGSAGRGGINPGGVTVTHEGTAGPYQYVQVTATNAMTLTQWLNDHMYNVPPDIEPVIAAYVREGFGFMAVRLRPGFGTQQMTPVRVITPGAGLSLPLRMVAAGTGPFVAITLYVIAEGRYEVDGFGQATIDASKLTWDWSGSNSNYATLRTQALGALDGKVWLASFSEPQAFTRTYFDALDQPITFNVDRGANAPPPQSFSAPYSTLIDLYFAQAGTNANRSNCSSSSAILDKLSSTSPVVDTCKEVPPSGDAGSPAGDAAVPGSDAGALPPPTTVCDPAPAGTIAASSLVCDGFSDIASAMIGMHPSDVWVTRLEANLPRAALAADLTIKPAAKQDRMPSTYRAAIHVNPPCDLLENHPEVMLLRRSGYSGDRAGVGVLSTIGLFFARRLRRRRGA